MDYYIYNEISYKKGYELEDVDIYNAMDKKTVSLVRSRDALDSFIKCIDVVCGNDGNNQTDMIENLKLVLNGSLFVEGGVFGVEIDYEKLLDTFKSMSIEDFTNYIFSVREAISLCVLNELGKKRTELEYAITLSEDVFKRFEEFKDIMEKLFSIKNSENKNYYNIDIYLDEYIKDNLMNLQRNIISGSPLKVAKDMLEKVEDASK